MTRVVHYVNQFFAGLGGEEKAGLTPARADGPLGPGQPLQALLGEAARIVATVYCGDNHFGENEAAATEAILALVAAERPGLFIAGPAFDAGRYGIACGGLARAVSARLGIPAIAAMAATNPAAEAARREVPVVATGSSAREMGPALERMAAVARKLLCGEPLGPSVAEGLLPRGGRRNVWVDRPAAARALDLLVAKLAGTPFETEIPLPAFDAVPRPPGLPDLRRARVALVTTAGLVPRGNPDRLTSYLSSRYGRYDLTGIDDLSGTAFESVHGGFFTAHVNEDPDRMVPVDALRQLEREGALGALHEAFYSTVGNGTPPETAKRLGQEIAGQLKEGGVEGVILTSS